MNKIAIIAIIAAFVLVTAGSLYWYRQQAAVSVVQKEVAPALTQSDSFEDIQKDMKGTQVVIEDEEYSTVTTDINGF